MSDTVVEAMRRTGIDVSPDYKETGSEGGLAVNVIECYAVSGGAHPAPHRERSGP